MPTKPARPALPPYSVQKRFWYCSAIARVCTSIKLVGSAWPAVVNKSTTKIGSCAISSASSRLSNASIGVLLNKPPSQYDWPLITVAGKPGGKLPLAMMCSGVSVSVTALKFCACTCAAGAR